MARATVGHCAAQAGAVEVFQARAQSLERAGQGERVAWGAQRLGAQRVDQSRREHRAVVLEPSRRRAGRMGEQRRQREPDEHDPPARAHQKNALSSARPVYLVPSPSRSRTFIETPSVVLSRTR